MISKKFIFSEFNFYKTEYYKEEFHSTNYLEYQITEDFIIFCITTFGLKIFLEYFKVYLNSSYEELNHATIASFYLFDEFLDFETDQISFITNILIENYFNTEEVENFLFFCLTHELDFYVEGVILTLAYQKKLNYSFELKRAIKNINISSVSPSCRNAIIKIINSFV